MNIIVAMYIGGLCPMPLVILLTHIMASRYPQVHNPWLIPLKIISLLGWPGYVLWFTFDCVKFLRRLSPQAVSLDVIKIPHISGQCVAVLESTTFDEYAEAMKPTVTVTEFTAVDLLRELYEDLVKENITHGHGDIGSYFKYAPELEAKIKAVLALEKRS